MYALAIPFDKTSPSQLCSMMTQSEQSMYKLIMQVLQIISLFFIILILSIVFVLWEREKIFKQEGSIFQYKQSIYKLV